jgi:hypothetical protein
MLLPEQTDEIARLINNHGEQAEDVTSQHADVECVDFSNSCIPTAKCYLASCLTTEPNPRLDANRLCYAAYTTETISGSVWLKMQVRQDGCTEYCQVGSCIH